MVLIISNSGAYEVECVRIVFDLLKENGINPVIFRADKCLEGEYIGYRITNGRFVLYAIIDGKEIDLSKVKAIWYLKPRLPKSLRQIQPFQYQPFVRRQFLAIWHSLIGILQDKRWISPHWNVYQAENKPYQLSVASQVGFEIPDTLITSDPEEVRKFWKYCHREMIVKLLAVSPMEDHVIYTNKLTEKDMNSIDTVRLSPAIFQRYVSKKLEYRITVVGDKIFTAKVDSQCYQGTKIDWRKDPGSDKKLNITSAYLPAHVENMCIELTKRLGLRFGCIDMILTPDNHYIFLEINPNGQWWFIQKYTELPIAEAIVGLLCGE